jgi:hypothetical protein
MQPDEEVGGTYRWMRGGFLRPREAPDGWLQFNKVSGLYSFPLRMKSSRGLMTREQLDRLLNPESMTAPRTTPATER